MKVKNYFNNFFIIPDYPNALHYENGYYRQKSIISFWCPRCPKGYAHKTNLYRHLKYECGLQPTFMCHHCPYKAKRKTHLVDHIARRHFNIV